MDDLRYMVDRMIALARSLERAEIELEQLRDELDTRDEALEKALDRVAVLESVELLSELKDIENASNSENGV